MIAGDFNAPLEVRDRKGCGSFDYDMPNFLYYLCDKLQLSDIWRLLHPKIDHYI